MVPPPKPLPRATVVDEMANGPAGASTLAVLGAGPRSNGLVAAGATDGGLSPAGTRTVIMISRRVGTTVYLLRSGMTQRRHTTTRNSTAAAEGVTRMRGFGERA